MVLKTQARNPVCFTLHVFYVFVYLGIYRAIACGPIYYFNNQPRIENTSRSKGTANQKQYNLDFLYI